MKKLDWNKTLCSNRCAVGALAAALTLLIKVFIAVDPPFEAVYAYLLALPYAAFVYPVLTDARTSRVPGLALLLIGLGWALLSSATHLYAEAEIARLMSYFLLLLLAVFVCWPLAARQPNACAGKTLSSVFAVLIALVALLSLLGLALALTGRTLAWFPGGTAGYATGRLYAFLYPTAFAAAAALSLLLTPYVYDNACFKGARALLLVAAALTYLAMALTGATVVLLLFALCAGGYAFLLAQSRLKTDRRVKRALLSLLLAAAALAVCFGGQLAVKRAVDAVIPQPAAQSAAAPAPRALPDTVAPQSTTYQKLALPQPVLREEEPAAALGFAGTRVALWKAAAQMFRAHPALLITGTSPVQMEAWLAPYLPAGLSGANMRMLPVQALVAFGVPGLILTLAFALYVLLHAARLFFCGKSACSVAERSLALVPLFCLLLDCTDCMLTFTDAASLVNPVFFLAGGCVTFLSVTRIPSKNVVF